MADIINLRAARKARARSEKEAVASANRIRFGQSSGEKRAVRDEAERLGRKLDGVRRESD
ncbi:MAG: DUF4169 family protein [Pseudomonadota bacterium]